MYNGFCRLKLIEVRVTLVLTNANNVSDKKMLT
jgi:hypothetical protein